MTSGWRLACGLILCLGCIVPAWGAEEEAPLPRISDLVRPTDGEETLARPEEGPVFPKALSVEAGMVEAAALLPRGAAVYLESPNMARAGAEAQDVALLTLLRDSRVRTFLRENPLALADLFRDVPPTYVHQDAVALARGALTLAEPFLSTDGRVALAGYAPRGGTAGLVFLAEIGRDRRAAHEQLQAAREALLAEIPTLLLEEDAHDDDYLDVLRSDTGGAALGVGIVRSWAVIVTDPALGRRILDAAETGLGEEALARGEAYRRLPARTDPRAHLRGWADLPALARLAEERRLPGGQEMLAFAVDMAGQGTVFYDARAEGTRLVEHVASPLEVPLDAPPGLPRQLARVLRPKTGGWTTPALLPYKPDFVVIGETRPAVLRDLLQLAQPFGGSPYAQELADEIPPALLNVLGRDIGEEADRILRGEAALALLPPGADDLRDWLIVFRLGNVPDARRLFDRRPAATSLGGVKIWSEGGAAWREMPAWTLLSTVEFQNLDGAFLLLAKRGQLLETQLEQVTALSASLADNRDFQRVADLGGSPQAVWYYNIPAVVNRRYLELVETVSEYYPRVRSLVSRPPIGFLNENLFGLVGGVAVEEEAGVVRSTLVSPSGTAPALSGLLVLNMPRWMRERAREHLSASRANLGRMWMALQNYATTRGHFPEGLDEFLGLFAPGEREEVFASPAAAAVLGPDAARRRSYRYIPGLSTMDEPGRPIVYEADAWHYEFMGMMPGAGDEPAETGAYVPWRLVLQLDGTIRAYPEEVFQREILPRIQANQ